MYKVADTSSILEMRADLCKPVLPYYMTRRPVIDMTKIPSTFVIVGAVAAAALVVPGVLGPLMFDEAYAQASDTEQSNRAIQNARDTLVNVQANVQANADVDVNDVTACVIVSECNR